MEEWEPVELTWHGPCAVLDQVLLAGGKGVYGLPPWDGSQEVPFVTPLSAGEKVLRHRVCPEFLRARDGDYYLPPVDSEWLARHRCRPLVRLASSFAPGLQALGNGYYRDNEHAWYFDAFSEYRLDNVRLSAFRALEKHPSEVPIFATDGVGLWKSGLRIADTNGSCRATNHPDYLILNGQVCWTKYGLCKPLYQKNGKPLPIDFPERFYMLAARWGTDGHSVFIQAQSGSDRVTHYFCRIDGVDLDTFQVLNQRYAMDANRAWYVNGKAIPCTGRFRIIVRNESGFDAHGNVLHQERTLDPYFAADDLHVYAAGVKLAGADGASFQHLEFDWYRDRNHIYCNKKRLEVDADSFVVTRLDKGDDEFSPVLTCDKNGPLDSRGITPLQIAQWAPFFEARPWLQGYWWHRSQKPLAPDPGAEDAVQRLVRYKGFSLYGLDPGSFRVVNLPMAVRNHPELSHSLTVAGDHGGIYAMRESPSECTLTKVSTRPVSSLQVVGPCYFSDGESVFYWANWLSTPTVLRQADPATFTLLEGGWSRDAKRSYYLGKPRKDFPPDRLHVSGSYAWTDQLLLCDGKPFTVEVPHSELKTPHPSFLVAGTKLFYGRRPVSTTRVHLPTLEFFDHWFAQDRNHIYTVVHNGLAPIEAVDRATFRPLGDGRAMDFNRQYDALPHRPQQPSAE